MRAPSKGPLRDATSEATGAQSKCLRIATGAPWYMSSKQIHVDMGVSFFADHIKAMTGSFESKLADAGNPLVRQLGRYLTEGRPKSPEAQAKCDNGQQTSRARPDTATKSTKRIVLNSLQLGAFRLSPVRVYRHLSSVVRRMPGYNFMQRRGTARITLQTQRPHQSACIRPRIRSCGYATLGSNPRKPSNQSTPSHIFVVNELLYSRQYAKHRHAWPQLRWVWPKRWQRLHCKGPFGAV
jgi:hypothetical protein